MKNAGLLFLFYFLGSVILYGQKIQYSRQTIRSPLADAAQLVADVGGNHHLLYFAAGKKPKLFIFNRLLQLVDERELEQKLNRNSEVRLIPFRNHYFLYSHVPETKTRSIIRIDSEGVEQDYSDALTVLMDSAGIDHAASLQFVNEGTKLFLISHSYFEGTKQIRSTITEANSEMKLVGLQQVVFPFDRQTENFQQSLLFNGNLVVLKSHRDAEMGSVLEVVKFNLKSGDVLTNYFSSPMHWYVSPAMRYSETDSTLLIYSLLREPIGSTRMQRTVFLAKLNDSLQPTTPLGLLRNQFRNNAGFSFLLLDGAQPHWLSFVGNLPVRRTNTRSGTLNYLGDNNISNIDVSRFRDTYQDFPVYYSQPTAVRLTVLNDKLTTTKDSLVTNDRTYYDLQPRPSSQFTMGGKSYLVLIQNFSANKRGLVLMHTDKQGTLATTPLPVYDRYEYNPSLLQSVNDYFILPYSNGRETGLLKITMTN